MKSLKKWRHYCGFCKKSGSQKPRMQKHENHCTNNPNRVCGMCKLMGIEQKPVTVLRAALGNGAEPGLRNLRISAENCPACILATIRRASDFDPFFHFDYKEEAQKIFKEINKQSINNM